MKKFMKVMRKEVNVKMELDGKAEWGKVKQDVARKFRVTSGEVEQIAKYLKKKKKLELKRKKIKLR